MNGSPGRRRMHRPAVLVSCAAIVAAGGALTVARQIDRHGDTTLPRTTCGTVTTHLLDSDTVLLQADPGALACFRAAARNCRSASIGVWEMGVDAGTRYVFTIDSGGTGCQATQLSQAVGFNFGGSHSNITAARCRKVAVISRGVVLYCGAGQTDLIPAKVSEPT